MRRDLFAEDPAIEVDNLYAEQCCERSAIADILERALDRAA